MFGADAEVVAKLTLDESGAVKGATAAATATRTVGTAATASTAKVGILKRGLQALSANVVIAGIAALYGAFRLLGESVGAAGVQQLAERKLANSLRNLGEQDAPAAVEGLKSVTGELQNLTGIGDEVQLTGLSILGTFKGVANAEGLKILAPRLLDMAAANRKAGEAIGDVKGEAQAMGKALEGGAAALRRYGVSLTDAEADAINAAEGLDKVNALAKVLDANFKGAAEAAADPFAVLSAAAGDLLEEVGGTDGQGLRGALAAGAVKLAAIAQSDGAVRTFRFIGRAAAFLIGGIFKVVDAFDTFQYATTRAGRGAIRAFLASLQTGLDGVAQFVQSVETLVNRLPLVNVEISRGLENTADAVGELVNRYDESIGALESERAAQVAAKQARDRTAAAAARLSTTIREATEQTTSGAAATRDLASSMAQVERGAAGVTTSVDQIRNSVAALETRIREMQGVDVAELVALEDQKQRLEAQLAEIERVVELGVLRMRGELGNLDASAVANRNTLTMPPIDDDAFQASLERAMAGVQQFRENLAREREQSEAEARQFGQAIESGIASGIDALAESLGEFTVGAAGFGDIGKTIISSLASLAQQVGSMMIAFGTAGLGLKALIKNPVLSIAAGAALVALGAAAKAAVGGAVSGGRTSTPAPDRQPALPSRGTSDVAAGLALGYRPSGERAGADRQPASVTVNNQPPPVHVQIYGESTKEGIRRVKVTQDRLPSGGSL